MSCGGGERPDLVFVPGLGLDSREWNGVRRFLNDRDPGVNHDSVVLLPSLGQRAPRGTDLSVEALADRLIKTIRPAGAVLVGHSAGCPVVIQAAVRCPSVVGLVLVGPVTDPRAATWPRMLTQWARTATHERLREIPILVPQYGRTGLGSIARGMNTIRAFRSDLAIARTTAPVAIVHGTRDRIAPYDWCARLADAAAGPGGVTSVANAGHMVPLTHPQAVAAAIRAIRAQSTRDETAD
jgi:pimeloyl-ACP methyl ester carboxylesterase